MSALGGKRTLAFILTAPRPATFERPEQRPELNWSVAHSGMAELRGPYMAPVWIDHCYWTQKARPERFEPLSGDVEVDVAVIGGGIVGTIAARLLKDRGHNVAIVDAGRIGH